MSVVELQGVTKRFRTVTAVHDLSLSVPEGSIYGFIGPNGSGKTTTIRMIMRILLPDAGHIRIFDEEQSTAATDRIGYLPEERGLYKKMGVREILSFYARLKGLRRPAKQIDAWLARMELSEWADKKVEMLSKGMSQKVQFIAAVVSHPRLAILDEPFTGLDPVNVDVLREAILELKRAGTTVIFSTHDMSAAERMCDYIFMIFRGQKVLDGTLAEIQNRFGSDTVRLRIAGQADGLAALPGVSRVVNFGNYQELRLSQGTDPQVLLAGIMRLGQVELFEITRPSLHDVFVRIAGPEAPEVEHG